MGRLTQKGCSFLRFCIIGKVSKICGFSVLGVVEIILKMFAEF